MGLSTRTRGGMCDSYWMYTDAYRPPELCVADNLCSTYSNKADIWALGCTLYEFLTGETLFTKGSYRHHESLFPDISEEKYLRRIQRGSMYGIPVVNTGDDEFNHLLEWMLNMVPGYRPSPLGVLNSAYCMKYDGFSPVGRMMPKGRNKRYNISSRERNGIMQWLAYNMSINNASPGVLFGAMDIFDRFTSVNHIEKDDIQAVSVACMSLIDPNYVHDGWYKDTYTHEHILNLQFTILKSINYEVYSQHLDIISEWAGTLTPCGEAMKHLSVYLEDNLHMDFRGMDIHQWIHTVTLGMAEVARRSS